MSHGVLCCCPVLQWLGLNTEVQRCDVSVRWHYLRRVHMCDMPAGNTWCGGSHNVAGHMILQLKVIPVQPTELFADWDIA